MEIFKIEAVAELENFYAGLLFELDQFKTIKEHLAALAVRMWEGVQTDNAAVLNEIANYHWDHLGKSPEVLLKTKLTEDSCRQAIANEYGFRRWTEVEHLNFPYRLTFEHAVNTLLEGDLETLKRLLESDEGLLNRKSDYGHKATLLHYAASNGVEMWRQKVPQNLPEIVAFLLKKGINTKAKMKVYNGEYTASELLLSSAHPRDAGILKELRKLF